MTVVAEAITPVHRAAWARVVAALTRRFGDLDIAEDMAAEAFAVAVERWPSDGVPPSPGAWITTTANRRAIDRLRRESRAEVAYPTPAGPARAGLSRYVRRARGGPQTNPGAPRG